MIFMKINFIIQSYQIWCITVIDIIVQVFCGYQSSSAINNLVRNAFSALIPCPRVMNYLVKADFLYLQLALLSRPKWGAHILHFTRPSHQAGSDKWVLIMAHAAGRRQSWDTILRVVFWTAGAAVASYGFRIAVVGSSQSFRHGRAMITTLWRGSIASLSLRHGRAWYGVVLFFVRLRWQRATVGRLLASLLAR